ncbi:MAG TPA: protein kinase, partial [Gammaproteobacteria bacterium]|nr:protein kinase [Gammaproteobacteria bacterium]
FPAGSNPDPWEQLIRLEAVAKSAVPGNPESISALKSTIEVVASNEALGKFSDIFEEYTINRGLPKQTKDKKIKHIEALQKTITEAEESLESLKLQESDEAQSKKIGMLDELLSKQKECCKGAASVLTLSTYDLKSLVALPDATLDAMHTTLSIEGDSTWDTMVNKCLNELKEYETPGGENEKNKLIGTIKALKLIMILNGQTYVTSQSMSSLLDLENNILEGKGISFLRANNCLSNLKTAILNAHKYTGFQQLKNLDHEKQNLSGMLDELKSSSKHLSELFSQSQGDGNVSAEKLKKIQAIMDMQQVKVEGAMAVVGTPVAAPKPFWEQQAAVTSGDTPVEQVRYISRDKGLLEVAPEEWDFVKRKIAAAQSAGENKSYKIKKNTELGLNHSFIVVNNEPYAVEVGNHLGKGTFGKVKIIQTEFGNNFAVKVELVKESKAGEGLRAAEERNMRKTEKTILHELEKLKGTFKRGGEEEGSDKIKEYSIMDLELGADVFKAFINTGLLEKDRNFQYQTAISCLETIDKLHEKRIIHRDIKPENFMMHVRDAQGNVIELKNIKPENFMRNGQNDVVVVVPIDFGLSRQLEVDQTVEIAPMVGTFGYIAPEVINGGKVSRETDIYALGKMLNKNFAIDIPEMYADASAERPSIKDVVTYLKIQAQKVQDKEPSLPSFSVWKEAQSKTQLDPSAALAKAAAQVSKEVVAITQLSSTREMPTTTSPTHVLQFSNAGTTGSISPFATKDGRPAPPPPGYTSDGKKAPPPPPRQENAGPVIHLPKEENSWKKAWGPVIHVVEGDPNDNKHKPGG